jgi:hypothetical protein
LPNEQEARRDNSKAKSLQLTFNFTQVKKLLKNNVSGFSLILLRIVTAIASVVKLFKVHIGGFLRLILAGLAALWFWLVGQPQ